MRENALLAIAIVGFGVFAWVVLGAGGFFHAPKSLALWSDACVETAACKPLQSPKMVSHEKTEIGSAVLSNRGIGTNTKSTGGIRRKLKHHPRAALDGTRTCNPCHRRTKTPVRKKTIPAQTQRLE